MSARPLAGLTVVECGTSVAGPSAGQILGDLGARVFKIEHPQGGDDARHWGPPLDDGVSPVFQAFNRNKRSATIDLKSDAERSTLRGFILREADIVIQNLRPGLSTKYGLDGATLRASKPSLIYCSIGAFGAVGPLRSRPGYDPLMQACAGIMSVTGHQGEEPIRVGPSIIDQAAGMWAVIGILAALNERAHLGVGCEVDTSLFEAAVAWLPVHIVTMRLTGTVPGPMGSEMAGMAPHKAFRANDGWVVIAAGNDHLFRRLSHALDCDRWLSDERFSSNQARVINRRDLNQEVQESVSDKTVAWLVEALDAVGVPCAPVLTLDQVVAEPQFTALGMLQSAQDGGKPMIGLPVSFDGQRPPLVSSAPVLGEATRLILGETEP